MTTRDMGMKALLAVLLSVSIIGCGRQTVNSAAPQAVAVAGVVTDVAPGSIALFTPAASLAVTPAPPHLDAAPQPHGDPYGIPRQ